MDILGIKKYFCVLIAFVIFLDISNAGLIDGLVQDTLSLTPELIRLGVTKYDLSEFLNFKINFDRDYSSDDEEKQSLLSFVINLRQIRSHNEKYEKGESKYEESINNLTDISHAEFVATHTGYMGIVKPKIIRNIEYGPTKIPEYLNYVDEGLVTRVAYQGYCGACWAFSANGALEAQLAKKTGKLIKLSEQNLIDCNKNYDYGNWGCRGGNMQIAYNFIKSFGGIDPASVYPYRGRGNYPCKYDQKKSVGTVSDFVEIQSGNETELQLALINAGPIAVAIDASVPSFQSYQSGIYDDPECTVNPNHAVLLVGYGTDPKFGDYWLLKNSWGKEWGENGFFRLPRDQGNSCGIAVDASYPIV